MTSIFLPMSTCKMGNISSMYMTSHSFSRIFRIPPSSSDLLQYAFLAQISLYILATEVRPVTHNRELFSTGDKYNTITVSSLSRSIVTVVPIRTLNTYGTMGLCIYFIYLFATRTQSYHGLAKYFWGFDILIWYCNRHVRNQRTCHDEPLSDPKAA